MCKGFRYSTCEFKWSNLWLWHVLCDHWLIFLSLSCTFLTNFFYKPLANPSIIHVWFSKWRFDNCDDQEIYSSCDLFLLKKKEKRKKKSKVLLNWVMLNLKKHPTLHSQAGLHWKIWYIFSVAVAYFYIGLVHIFDKLSLSLCSLHL